MIIPSTNFLSKKDVRLSYGHEFKAISEVVRESNSNTISEYELAKYLIEEFNLETLKDEDEIINYYVNHEVEVEETEPFVFIEDVEIEPLYKNKTEDNFYLITAKNKNSLNSQFNVDNNIYLNSKSGFSNDDNVKVSSIYGEAVFSVKINDDIKDNCAFFYAGNRFVNYLTPNKDDEESHSAMYQEVLIQIELC